MTDEQGLGAVRDVLLTGNRMGIGEPHRLSLADKFILKRLEAEGLWMLLTEIFEHEKAKSRALELELHSAFEIFSSGMDSGRTAFISSVKSLQDYAFPICGPISGLTLERRHLAAS